MRAREATRLRLGKILPEGTENPVVGQISHRISTQPIRVYFL